MPTEIRTPKGNIMVFHKEEVGLDFLGQLGQERLPRG